MTWRPLIVDTSAKLTQEAVKKRNDNGRAKELGADLTIPVEQLSIQALYGRLSTLNNRRPEGVPTAGLPSLARHSEKRVMIQNIIAEQQHVGLQATMARNDSRLAPIDLTTDSATGDVNFAPLLDPRAP
eukprot:2706558-Prymnesium_polylepis.1